MSHTGSVLSKDPRAAAQAASIGATINNKGWWMKDGQHLSPEQADALTRQAGSAIQSDSGGVDGIPHGGFLGNAIERNRDFTGNLLKNIAPLAAFIPGIGPFAAAALAGVGGAAGAGIQHGGNFGSILKNGISSASLASGISGGLSAAGGAASNGAGLAGQIGSGLKGAATGYINGPSNAMKGVGGALGIGSMGNAAAAGDASGAFGGGGYGDGYGTADGTSYGAGGDAGTPAGGGIVDRIGKALGGTNGGGSNPLGSLGGLLNVGAMANAVNLQDKSSNFAKLAGESVDRSYNERAGLRAAGIAGMGGGNAANKYTPTGIPAVNLPQLGALAKQGNPFALAG